MSHMAIRHYILDSNHQPIEVDMLTWAFWLEKPERIVAQTNVGQFWVSTVFLGLDHDFSSMRLIAEYGGGEPVGFLPAPAVRDDGLCEERRYELSDTLSHLGRSRSAPCPSHQAHDALRPHAKVSREDSGGNGEGVVTKHTWFLIGGDCTMTAALVFNLIAAFRNGRLIKKLRQLHEKAEQFDRDQAPLLVSALDQLAESICPLCAVAAGKGELCDLDGVAMHPEPESGGKHIACIDGRKAETECRAAKVRADARKIMEEAMAEPMFAIIEKAAK